MKDRSLAPQRVACCALALAIPWWSAFAAASRGLNPGVLQPDLVIVDVQAVPATPNRLHVRVANQGLAPAAETQMEVVYARGGKATAAIAAVPMLQTGERQWLVVEVGASPTRADSLTLRIDEPSRVIESDEGNNAYVYR